MYYYRLGTKKVLFFLNRPAFTPLPFLVARPLKFFFAASPAAELEKVIGEIEYGWIYLWSV